MKVLSVCCLAAAFRFWEGGTRFWRADQEAKKNEADLPHRTESSFKMLAVIVLRT